MIALSEETVAPLVLIELGALLLALGVLGRLADRVDFSPIPLYLAMGVVLGTIGAGPISFSGELVEIGSQIGIVLLLFMLGLEYAAKDLAASLRRELPAAAVDAVLNFPPGVLMGALLGWDIAACLLLGGVTYISSSGVIAKLLADLGRLEHRETPAVLSILVMEDLAMAAYLPLVTVLVAGAGLVAGAVSLSVALAAAGVALYLAARYGHAASRLLSSRSEETLLLITFGAVLLIAGVAEAVQLSAAVGAFLAGIALSGPIVHRARTLLTPLRDLFAATFFVFFGLQLDLAEIPGVAPAAVTLAAATVAAKIGTGWFAARAVGTSREGRLRAGTALIAHGEFSLVIAGIGVTFAVEPELGPLAATYVFLTAFAGPLAARVMQRDVRHGRPAC